jgi:EAL domain-containing protein (putative c-di-GMP-specific phosphodiesterase class I)
MGCDFAQGFYIGRPMDADECRRYLQTQESPRPVVLAAVRNSK